MRLDDKLNLIIPIPRGSGFIYVHSAPLSREVFEQHYLIIARTFAALTAEGLSVAAAPRVAALMLKDLATKAGNWDGAQGVAQTLIQEMVRLSHIVVPRTDDAGGWEAKPLYPALRDGTITDDERSEVMGAIVFFTVNSAMHRRMTLLIVLEMMDGLWGTLTSPLGPTEYADSLPRSTTAGGMDTRPGGAAVLVPS